MSNEITINLNGDLIINLSAEEELLSGGSPLKSVNAEELIEVLKDIDGRSEGADEVKEAIERMKDFIEGEFGIFDPSWETDSQDKYALFYNLVTKRPDFGKIEAEKSYAPIGYLRSPEEVSRILRECSDDLDVIMGYKD